MKTHTFKVLAAASLIAATVTFAAPPDAERPMPQMSGHHARMIERFDADGDGRLNDAEQATAKSTILAENPELAARHAEKIKRFDTDGDGQLNDTERAVAR